MGPVVQNDQIVAARFFLLFGHFALSTNDVARACSSKFPNELIDLSNDVIALRLKPSATQWAAESPTNPLGFDITQK